MLEFKIKKEWFDMIKSGKKKEEYRDIKPFYTSRFNNILRKTNTYYWFDDKSITAKNREFDVIFVNGYGANDPKIKCKCKLRIGQGREEWGAIPGQEYYILEILEVKNESIKNKR